MTLHAEPSAKTTLYLSITVNHYVHDGLWAVRVEDNALWLASRDAKSLGIALNDGSRPWINLASRKDIKAEFDPLQQHLSLTLKPSALNHRQHLVSQPPPSSQVLPQAETMGTLSLDYSLYASESATERQASVQSRMQSSGWLPGQLSSSMNSRIQQGQNDARTRHTRLMTAWQYDMPQSLTSLTLGDAITTGVSWSRQVRFAGLHLSRNFQLDPRLNTAPRAEFSDSVVLPSTVDLYIDGLRQSRQRVAPGNYVLDTMPTFSGRGQAQVVITDINGQRREVTLDVYGTPDMLAKGMSSHSLDIGWLRENYAEHSNDYAASPLLDAGWRYGVSNQLTLGVHSEQHRQAHNIGIASDWLPSPRAGVLSGHLATSQGKVGNGVKWGLGYQWNAQGSGFSLNTSRSSDDWSDIARVSGSLPVSRSDSLWLSQALPDWGTLGAGWVRQDSVRYINASWSRTFDNRISATLGYSHSLSNGDKTVQLLLSLPLGRRDTVSFQTRQTATRWDYRHQPDDLQGGWSWQLARSDGQLRQQHAELGHLSRYGEWRVGLDRDNRENSRYLTGEGSLMLLEKHAYALRYNQQGMALITTNGIGHIPIAIENRPAGETDENGFLLLTDLPRYHQSKITLDPLRLPPDVVTPVTDIHAAPGVTEAVKVDFHVHRSRLVTAKVVDKQRHPLPMGSRVNTPDGATIVGRDGFIWLENPPMPGKLEIQQPAGRCQIRLPASEPQAGPVNLGELSCL